MKCCCGAHVDTVTKTFAEYTLRSCVAAIILSSMLMSGAAAAGPGQETATPPKIQELLILLVDPKVQEWLKDQGAAKTAAGPTQETDKSIEDYLNSRAGVIRAQIVALARAVPDLPNQFEQAAARDRAIHGEYGRAWAFLYLAVFGSLGLGAE